MIYSFRYIRDNDGICTESSYPYLGYVSIQCIVPCMQLTTHTELYIVIVLSYMHNVLYACTVAL